MKMKYSFMKDISRIFSITRYRNRLIGPIKTVNKQKGKLFACMTLIALCIFFIWWYDLTIDQSKNTCPDYNFNQSNSLINPSNRNKTILLWNAHRRKEMRVFGTGMEAFVQQNCPFDRCEIVTDREKRPLSTYDAIIINFNDEFLSEYERKLPEFHKIQRSSIQRVVMFTQESPPALIPYYNISHFDHVFNWTMTYRKDSDIPIFYGRVLPKESAPLTTDQIMHYRQEARHNQNLLSANKMNKTKLVAWMVSHCKTHGQREKYAEELGKYVDVDIYGKCGNLSCSRHVLYHSDPQCYTMLESTYKFYLSFENAICKDYVTEKLFKIINHHIVPIVFGGANYTDHLPPYSYINALDYTPKELANYLKLLDSNVSLYNEYFWWKDHYRVESNLEDMAKNGFCKLCEKLHQDDGHKFYEKLSSFWDVDNQCNIVYKTSTS